MVCSSILSQSPFSSTAQGLGKEKDKEKEKRDNSYIWFWVYDITNDCWNCIYKRERGVCNGDDWEQRGPCQRSAHQMVYDHKSRMHYLFGGNPGSPDLPDIRLGDFWSLEVGIRFTSEPFTWLAFLKPN